MIKNGSSADSGWHHRADNPLSLCNGCKNGSLNMGIIQYIVLQYITFISIKQAFFYTPVLLDSRDRMGSS